MRVALVACAAVLAAAPHAEAGHVALARYLRDDTSLVIVADVAHLRSTPRFAQLASAAEGKLGAFTAADAKLADTIVAGATTGSGDRHWVIVVDGRGEQLLGKLTTKDTPRAQKRSITVFTLPSVELAVIDRRLVVTSTGDMAGVIERAAGKAKGARTARALLASVPPGTDLWGGMSFDATARAQIALWLGEEPSRASLALSVATGLTLTLRFELADDVAATRVATSLSTKLADSGARVQLEGLVGKDFSDSIAIVADGAAAMISATLTSDELDRVLPLAKMTM